MNNGRGEEAWVGSSRAPPLGVKKKYIYNQSSPALARSCLLFGPGYEGVR